MANLLTRVKNGWNAFLSNKDPTSGKYGGYYLSSGGASPFRTRRISGNYKSIIGSIYNWIAVDVSQVDIKHVRLDDQDRYQETIKDSLNEIFQLRANKDQSSKEFLKDIITSLFDEGCVALVPIDTDIDPTGTSAFQILSVRVGKIIQWFPDDVLVEVYDDQSGTRKQIRMSKRITPIIHNPFYEIMNTPNSIAQRLFRVHQQLDRTNETNSAGKIDLLIQVPYAIKSEGKKALAESRLHQLEAQLSDSTYGIGYVDSTEKVIQLNRSIENDLWNQEKDLTERLFSQLGLSKAVFDGTADEATMINYQNRTVTPLLSAITDSVIWCWISRTARSQGQSMRFFKDPFKLVPVSQLAEISDKFTRNEIMTSNEIRSVIGLRPADDPKADTLRNSNLNHPDEKEMLQANKEENKEEVDNALSKLSKE